MNDKTILLVEDDLPIQELYQHILQGAGLTVVVAADGEEALQIIQAKPITLVLLDIMMPKLNGIETLIKLKNDPAHKKIPVVLVTNLGQQEVIHKAFELGAQGYILKVRITPSELISTVNKYLNNPDFTMDVNSIIFD